MDTVRGIFKKVNRPVKTLQPVPVCLPLCARSRCVQCAVLHCAEGCTHIVSMPLEIDRGAHRHFRGGSIGGAWACALIGQRGARLTR